MQTQYASRLQWCELLRSSVFQVDKKLPQAEEKKKILNMVMQARVAATLPAAAHARYGDQSLKAKNRKDFREWVGEDERWRSTKVDWVMNDLKQS